MTRDEWKRFDRIKHDENVQFAMRARCEEDRHDWENCASVTMQVYQACKWCGAKR